MGGTLGWMGIFRLGLVQTSIGSIVVLVTATLNRVMVVELSMAAVIPGLLVGLHYGVQLLRPLWGHASDVGGRRTRWIVGGVALLGLGAAGASVAIAVMAHNAVLGLVLAFLDFVLIGVGVGAAGTSLLALLASSVAPERRPAAATIVWLMMIAGMAVTATVAGGLLEPFSFGRLIGVVTLTGAAAVALTVLALWGIEQSLARASQARPARQPVSFRRSLADAWADPKARLFTIFVFVSMLAFSAQDLILEPFAGLVFGWTPGETTRLAGVQHGGVFLGMVLTGVAGSLLSKRYPGALRVFTVGGCLASALALCCLTLAAAQPEIWPLGVNVFALGFANGVFAVAAIGSMMALAGAAGPERTGMRMGLWGAAQAIAFGLGGLLGTVLVDLSRWLTGEIAFSYGLVFLAEALAFLAAAALASRVAIMRRQTHSALVETVAHATPAE
ncbi:MFS transporter [Chelativorans sp. ZYF759]|nr:MFS transporter [Chelativorans sp. ZYF759]